MLLLAFLVGVSPLSHPLTRSVYSDCTDIDVLNSRTACPYTVTCSTDTTMCCKEHTGVDFFDASQLDPCSWKSLRVSSWKQPFHCDYLVSGILDCCVSVDDFYWLQPTYWYDEYDDDLGGFPISDTAGSLYST